MKILLVCSAGMSTSMLIKKMEAAAILKGIEAKVDAVPEASVKEVWEKYDVILLGPQVKFLESKIKEMIGGKVPVAVIDMLAYGRMDGEKVLQTAIDLKN